MKKRTLAAAFVLAFLWVQGAFAAEGALCRVSNGKNEMWLFGSIHIGSESMYPFSETVLSAAKHADTWVFETDPEPAEQELLSRMRYSDGRTLADDISAETLQLVEAAAQKCGYDAKQLTAIKPWALVTLFSAQNLAYSLGVSDAQTAAGLGVENQLKILAAEQRFDYLESSAEQFDMLNSFSAELQEMLLTDALHGILYETGNERELNRWPEWWKQGNTVAFAEAFEKEMLQVSAPLAEEYLQKVLLHRNHNMADQLIDWLEQGSGRSIFVTVGILHLAVSEESLPKLMESAGYVVEWVQ